ncbi:DUF4350 domain-containing protein [bacterium]|nr:DUF4350 domain-containing protein [bacterium]
MRNRFAISRRGLTITLLFAIFVTGIILFSRNESSEPAYDPDSRGAQGLLLWRVWLTEMGFRVETTGRARFDLPTEATLLFVYPGVEDFTSADADRVLDWVEAGGTLVLVGMEDSRLQERFNYKMAEVDFFRATGFAQQAQPLIPEGPGFWSGPGPVALPQAGNSAVPVLTLSDALPAVTVQKQGEGIVWILPSRYAFTNADLLEDEQPYLLIATLRGLPSDAVVVLDTYHLFGPSLLSSDRVLTVQEWLYTTPTGWATLFVMGLLVIFLVLGGRRLGPPLVVLTQGRRREAAEYVVAMAGLQRRANVSDAVARHHRRRLRQALGRRHRIPADLDDATFLARLRTADDRVGDEEAARIRRVLTELSALPNNDKLVDLVAEADEILSERHLR